MSLWILRFMLTEIKAFGYCECSALKKEGIDATIRRRLGTDIEAACGQLRKQNLKQ